ncbi:ABC transporter substrate-binding protein [Serratia entomophila]|uniref:ABC transporter substrate-binding protein n=1 Tax=Serratia entomophila TaxID=42906 RepID=UPI00217C71B8|nr:ABC transporter substrate-binding protein [Serratia entomophila]CAI1162357.1 Spermidine/putrescine-binding periplasmic protein precursor [Serratia entomophila]CAI1787766.1 Spermidine/putrescine-binding periplasmic protein precursor [Serratia entomophila]CAI1910248.1 Spermidine/putrescine-binding periplasmic protein precursor [Serratia entomophila]CAI1911047.1 Spermidine/putrescine-binding periplasmic protein precursor [Serratia entomophila]CAI1992605.1 Spermidine/putrescine-binding periplas
MKRYLTALILFVAATSWATAQTKELVVAAYGGAYTDALKKEIGQFEKENNVKIRFIPASGPDALAKAKAKEVDVIHADLAWGYRGEAQGLFEKLTPELVTNLASLYTRARFSDYGVITNFGQYGIAYNPDAVNPPPTSWYDLLSPKYRGHVSIAGFDDANIELLVLFAKLNGGSEDNIDPGFKKMIELSRNVNVFYSQHPQLLDLFRSGDVVMARWLRGRVAWANGKGVPVRFVVPQEGAIALVSTAHVVKGRPNVALAMKFINYLLSKPCQLAVARNLGYTPSRADLTEDLKLAGIDVPYGHDVVNALVMADWRKVTPHLATWKERWDREITR